MSPHSTLPATPAQGLMPFSETCIKIAKAAKLLRQGLSFSAEGRDHRLTGPNAAKIVTGIIA